MGTKDPGSAQGNELRNMITELPHIAKFVIYPGMLPEIPGNKTLGL
jgi:hypothetical protein